MGVLRVDEPKRVPEIVAELRRGEEFAPFVKRLGDPESLRPTVWRALRILVEAEKAEKSGGGYVLRPGNDENTDYDLRILSEASDAFSGLVETLTRWRQTHPTGFVDGPTRERLRREQRSMDPRALGDERSALLLDVWEFMSYVAILVDVSAADLLDLGRSDLSTSDYTRALEKWLTREYWRSTGHSGMPPKTTYGNLDFPAKERRLIQAFVDIVEQRNYTEPLPGWVWDPRSKTVKRGWEEEWERKARKARATVSPVRGSGPATRRRSGKRRP